MFKFSIGRFGIRNVGAGELPQEGLPSKSQLDGALPAGLSSMFCRVMKIVVGYRTADIRKQFPKVGISDNDYHLPRR